MREYTYRRWAGGDRTIEADRIEFTPTHVVFWRRDRAATFADHIVLAERAEQVNELRDTGPECGP